MAWTFRASGTAVTGNNASSLANIGLPSGWQAGDLHILHFQNYGGTNSRTPPATLSGWSDPTQWQNGTTSHAVYWRVAQAGDAAPTLSLSGTGATNDTQLARIHGFYPRAGATITRNVLGSTSTNASADNIGPITGITPTAADLVVLSCGKSNDWNGTATLTDWTLATGVTESTTGSDAGMALLYQTSSSGSATGNLTVTDNGATASAGVGLGILVSFKETLTKSYTPSGGAVAAGTATTAFVGAPQTKTYVGSGGAIAAGSATLDKIKAYTPSGGAVAAGAATTAYVAQTSATYLYVGSGGAAAAGAAETTWTRWFQYIGSGGSVAGGAATSAWQLLYGWIGSGGAETGGSATTAQFWLYGYTPTGGAETGGTAETAYTSGLVTVYAYTGSGGATTGGAASTATVAAPTTTEQPSGGWVTNAWHMGRR